MVVAISRTGRKKMGGRQFYVTLFKRMVTVEIDLFPMKVKNGQVSSWLRVISRSLTWKTLNSMAGFNVRLFVETCKLYV